jgi:hypothetical protein
VQIGLRREVRRVTEIVQVSRVAQGQKVEFHQLWQYDETSRTVEPEWIRLQGEGPGWSGFVRSLEEGRK